MRNFSFLVVTILTFLMACSKKEKFINPNEENSKKEYTVKLSLAGELTFEESPLISVNPNNTIPRSISSNDLIGIQITSRKKGTVGREPAYYGYGLFDDLSNLSIKLNSDSAYFFAATYIKDGKTKIHHIGNGYGLPFLTTVPYNEGALLGSNFTLDKTRFLTFIGDGDTNLMGNDSLKVFRRPPTDRYYGILNYDPPQFSSLTIPMKRAVFGVKYVVNGLKSGKLRIQLEGSPEVQIKSSDPEKSIQQIHTFSCVSCGLSDIYTEKVLADLFWEKEDGSLQRIALEYIVFKRKTLTTINITMPNDGENVRLSIDKEDEGLIPGETYNF